MSQTVSAAIVVMIFSGLMEMLLTSSTSEIVSFLCGKQQHPTHNTGPRSAVGNASGNRCSLTADPGVACSNPARSHTFEEIDHEIISTVILLPSAELFKKGCCQLQGKVCAQSTG